MSNLPTLYDSASIINYISDFLEQAFSEYKWGGFCFKTSDNPESGDATIPHIYRLICPPDEITDAGFPSAIPSVTLMLNSETLTASGGLTLSLSVHTALISPSISESEKAKPVEGDKYEIEPSTEYDRANSQRELYESCVVFTSRVARILRACPLNLGDIQSTPPQASLPDYPYITSRLDFTIETKLPFACTAEVETPNVSFIQNWL